jgi:uncharacterized OsmC-like protein
MTALAKQVEHIVNGVNVDEVVALVDAVQASPELANSRFRLTNKWISGGYNQSRISSFYAGGEDHEHIQEFVLAADEPMVLAGHDQGANPVEQLLSALAACLTTTLVYHAAVRGIEIRSLESSVEGDIDLRGFLGLSNDVRRGFENIRVSFRVDADQKNIETLKEMMTLSPVFDTAKNGTNIGIDIAGM